MRAEQSECIGWNNAMNIRCCFTASFFVLFIFSHYVIKLLMCFKERKRKWENVKLSKVSCLQKLEQSFIAYNNIGPYETG